VPGKTALETSAQDRKLRAVTAPRHRELPIAIAGSLLVHAVLFMLLAALFAVPTKWQFRSAQPTVVPVKQVTLVFPEQLIPPPPPPPKPVTPPPPPPKKEIYIRTTQNEGMADKPKSAAFISDRNTKASAKLAPDPAGKEPMPTTTGIPIQMKELANRDYRDGEIKEDSAPKTPPRAPAMQASAPPSPPPQPPAPPPQPPPQAVAAATPATTPLARMMEEADKDLARVDLNRLPIEVRKPEPAPTPRMKEPDAPPPTPQAPPKPQMRETADSPPQTVPKAIPVDEPVARNTPRPDDKAFMPFTRTSENKGTISNRGDEDAVDAEDSPKGRYIRSVTSQVEKKWHLYRVLKRDSVTFGSLKVEFYVNRRGKVEDLRIVNDRESNPLLSEFTLRAIRDAEIPPMPKDVIEILPMLDKQRLKIEYNVLIY
jgi:outer membrane biosynthesis protein TonB